MLSKTKFYSSPENEETSRSDLNILQRTLEENSKTVVSQELYLFLTKPNFLSEFLLKIVTIQVFKAIVKVVLMIFKVNFDVVF